MSIKAAVWKEENKRRVERFRLGAIGTLKAGLWPGTYRRLGYDTIKQERGNKIVLSENEIEIETVKMIFNWYDSGKPIAEIREALISQGTPQKKTHAVIKHPWSFPVINKILRCQDYTGVATWRFSDGTEYQIEIPQIIDKRQFKRVQKKMDTNKRLSPRNTKTIYLLQGIVYCGDCKAKATGVERRFFHRKLADGTTKKYYKKNPHSSRHYRCCVRCQNKNMEHTSPYCWKVVEIDNAVWNHLVEYAIKKPKFIAKQVMKRQAKLQAEGDNIDGEIAKTIKALQNIDTERAFYQKQGAKGLITEAEFEQRMHETQDIKNDLEQEIKRLKELRDNASQVKMGLDYAYALLAEYHAKLAEINQTQAELDAMLFNQRQYILSQRQKIIRGLCDKVYLFANGKIKIEGAISGDTVSQSDSHSPRPA